MKKTFHIYSCDNCKNYHEYKTRKLCFPRVNGYGCEKFSPIVSPTEYTTPKQRIEYAQQKIKEYHNALKGN